MRRILPSAATLLAVAMAVVANGALSSGAAHAAPKKAPSKPKAAKVVTGAPIAAEIIGVKARLEELLRARFGAGLSTLVPPSDFSLQARIDLREKPEPEKNLKSAPELPPDLELGAIDLDRVWERFDEKPGLPTEALARFQVTGVDLAIGLKGEAPAELKARVESWAKATLESEFPRIGKSSLSKIEPMPEPPRKREEFADRSWLEILRDLQGLIGQLALVAGILLSVICGVLLWRALAPPNASPRIEANLTIPELPIRIEAPAAPAAPPRSHDAEISASREKIETVVASAAAGTFVPMVESLARKGERGQLKLAHLLETLSLLGQAAPLAGEAAETMPEAFRKASALEPEARLSVLRELYWELIAFKNVGAGSIERRFDYLDGLEERMVNNILIEQNPRMRAVVAFHMAADDRKRYLRDLDESTRLALVAEALSIEELRKEEVAKLDSALRSRAGNGQKGGSIPLHPLQQELLASLDALAEIRALRQLASQKPQLVTEMRRSYATPAFFDSWNADAQQLILGDAAPEELAALFRAVPECQSMIDSCPQLTAELIRDALGSEPKPEAELQALETLRARVREHVESGQLSISQMDAKGAGPGLRLAHAA